MAQRQAWLDKAFAFIMERPDPAAALRYFSLLRELKLPRVPQVEQLARAMDPNSRQQVFCELALTAGDNPEGRDWLAQAGGVPASLQAKVQHVFGGPAAPAVPKEALGAVLDQVRLARPELGNLLTLRSTNIQPLQSHLHPGECLISYVSTGVDLLGPLQSRMRRSHPTISFVGDLPDDVYPDGGL